LKLEGNHPQIFSEDFKLTMMAESVALLRYQSFMLDDGQEIPRTERASIWMLSASEESDSHRQMRFHQDMAIDDWELKMGSKNV